MLFVYVCVVVFLHAASDKAPFVLSYLLLLLSPALPLSRLTLPLPSVLLFCIFAKLVKTKKILGRKKVYKKPVLFCYLCDCVCVCMWVSFPCVCVCVPVRELYALRSGFVILFFYFALLTLAM